MPCFEAPSAPNSFTTIGGPVVFSQALKAPTPKEVFVQRDGEGKGGL